MCPYSFRVLSVTGIDSASHPSPVFIADVLQVTSAGVDGLKLLVQVSTAISAGTHTSQSECGMHIGAKQPNV